MIKIPKKLWNERVIEQCAKLEKKAYENAIPISRAGYDSLSEKARLEMWKDIIKRRYEGG